MICSVAGGGGRSTRLSIVYSVRDPDYGHGLLHRMQVSLNALAALARDCRLDYELIVVEWNPPPGKRTIRESLSSPEYSTGRIRFIEVGPSVHDEFESGDELPFLEYIAKNVGIRRAQGDWILASSPDVLFNKQLVQFLACASLERESFYRIDRQDVSGSIPVGASWREALAICRKSVFLAHEIDGSFPVIPAPEMWHSYLIRRLRGQASERSPKPCDRPHTNASGDFFLMSRENWHRLRGYTELRSHAHIDSIICWTAWSAGLKQVCLRDGMRLYHQEHDSSSHKGFPQTDWRVWHSRFLDALQRGQVMVTNGEGWGLAQNELDEFVL